MKLWRIYKYTNIITGQSYIGQTIRNVNARAGKSGQRYHGPFREAIDKYGWENFEQSILRLCTSQEEADQYEQYYIEKFNTVFPNGYNLEGGGKSGNSVNDISKQKMADSQKGKHHSEETRQKLSDFMKEVMKNPEVRQKISKSMNGKNTWAKGCKWFNDGTKSVMAYSCPDGFMPGRLPFSKCN